jgi:5'-3' exonuclease
VSNQIVIIDFSVLIYKIVGDLETSGLSELPPILEEEKDLIETFKTNDKTKIIRAFIAASWHLYLNYGCPEMPTRDFFPVIVLDTKPYWRTAEFPDYKGGRKEKPPAYSVVRQIGLEIVTKSGFLTLGQVGYEADDMAALVVKTLHLSRTSSNPTPSMTRLAQSQIYLYTVDSDWLQMVFHEPSVTWVDVYQYGEKVRGPEETKAWALRRLKMPIECPQDIVAIKHLKGDQSDALPPGSPIHLIDLFNPPTQHRLTSNPYWIERVLSYESHPKNDPVKAQKSIKVLNVLRRYR